MVALAASPVEAVIDPKGDGRAKLLEAITSAQHAFIADLTPRESFEKLLSALLEVTESAYGFIGETLVDASGQPYLKTHAITNIAWNEETRRFYEQGAPAGLEFRNLDTLFGRVLVTSAPVIANEPATDPRRGGIPPGHPPLDHFLGLPFFSYGEMVGMVGIANRPGGYDQSVIDMIEPLTATCANLIFAARGARERAAHREELVRTNEALVEQVENRKRAEGALAQFFEVTLDLLCVADADGYFRHLNPAWTDVLGWSIEDLLARPMLDIVHPDDRERTTKELTRLLLESGRTSAFENRIVCRDGSYRWLRWSGGASAGGQLYGAARDVTQQKLTEAASARRVSELEERATQMGLLSEMGELLQSCGSMADIGKVVSLFLGRMFDGDSGSLYLTNDSRTLAESLASWGAPSRDVVAPHECWALRRGRAHRVEVERPGIVCDHASSQPSGGSVCVPLLAQGEAKGFLHVAFEHSRDPALRAAREQLAVAAGDQVALAIANVTLRERLHEQSIRDPLTGLFNRRYMQETLERELRQAERRGLPLTLVMIDLDHFKQYNDEQGHVAADALLREFGGLLMRHFRREDVPCRFGGEEFLVVLPGAVLRDAQARVEELRLKAANLGRVRREHRALTFSAGLASFPDHGRSPERLLRATDAAMYRAKADGRDRTIVAATD